MAALLEDKIRVTNIRIATLVERNKGTPIHKNRASHGIVMELNGIKTYSFENGRSLRVEQNDIIFLPKGSDYQVSSQLAGDCLCVNFEVEGELDPTPFVKKAKNAGGFKRQFEKAAEAWISKKPGYEMKTLSALYGIIALLQEEHFASYVTQSTASMIDPALEYIHQNYTKQTLCVAHLSKMCNVSEDYFRKIFKKVYGTSPVKYVNALKLNYARELLKSGECTITRAAELSGYNDLCYFSREFKKFFGVCPKEL